MATNDHRGQLDGDALEILSNTSMDTRNSPRSTTEMAAPTPSDAPSLGNPSWGYLYEKFTKVELQKHCRKLGLNGIYVTKDKLVDKIMEKHRSTKCHGNAIALSPSNSIHKLIADMEEMKMNLNIKETEIGELNELLKTAQVTINKLSDRITTLEETVSRAERNPSPHPHPPPETSTQAAVSSIPTVTERTLFLGDTNL